ncbi:hypothetical protein JCM6882_000194, partial [Rhodosporidiobolus microsporus]
TTPTDVRGTGTGIRFRWSAATVANYRLDEQAPRYSPAIEAEMRRLEYDEPEDNFEVVEPQKGGGEDERGGWEDLQEEGGWASSLPQMAEGGAGGVGEEIEPVTKKGKRKEKLQEGRKTTSAIASAPQRASLISLFMRHYCAHPSFPNASGG